MVQEADVRAFGSLGEFRGDSSLATWLTRINEAHGRLRRYRPMVDLAMLDAQPSGKSQVIPFPLVPPDIDAERAAAHRQIRHLIEQAIDGLLAISRSCLRYATSGALALRRQPAFSICSPPR